MKTALFKVDLEYRVAAKFLDEDGNISKEDFIKISQDFKLLDFGNVMAGVDNKPANNKRHTKSHSNKVQQRKKGSKVSCLNVLML